MKEKKEREKTILNKLFFIPHNVKKKLIVDFFFYFHLILLFFVGRDLCFVSQGP